MRHRTLHITGLMLVLAFTFTGAALAGDPDTSVIEINGRQITVDKDGDVLRIVNLEDGDEQIMELDLSRMSAMVNDAMADVGDMLAEFEDMQMTVRLGDDNRLSLAHDESYWELDLDEIMSQVGVALEGACEEIDMEAWTHHSRRHHFNGTDDDLQDELEALRDEVRQLREELRDIRKK